MFNFTICTDSSLWKRCNTTAGTAGTVTTCSPLNSGRSDIRRRLVLLPINSCWSMITDSRVDLDVSLLFPRLFIEGHYRSDVRFRGLPFINKGNFNISLADVSMTLRMTGKTYERDGERYVHMQHVRMRPDIADLKINISNLFGGAKDLSDMALGIANRYWFIFYNENLPVLEERWDPLMTGMINTVLSRVPFSHVFPQ